MANQNPFTTRWRSFGYGENKLERQVIEREARDAESRETYPCSQPECEGTCYYRPGVGGWWCDICGELEVA
jgi:ribosomal protein L37AE/L43A